MTAGVARRTLLRELLREYPLCDACLGRQYPAAQPGISNAEQGRLLRRRARISAHANACWLCGSLTQQVPKLAELVREALANIDFRTFLVGASLPSAFSEREDMLRARFKLRGGEPLKSELTREIGRRVAGKMRRRVRFRGADVTVLVDPLAGRAEVRSRPVFVLGRYAKNRRGLAQRQAKCAVCRGRGCDTCGQTGRGPEPSVEGVLRQVFIRAFQARDAIFTWVGSEDEDSLVLGRGRPFSAEIVDPKRRRLPPRLSKRLHGVRLTTLRVAKGRPTHLRDFTGHFRLLVETTTPVSPAQLREVEMTFRDRPVSAFSPRKQKMLTKRVYTVRAKRRGPRRLELLLKTDGGLNLKKFVSGGPSDTGPAHVSPNIATVLGASATCVRFDVLAIVPRGLARNP